jgi:hypothetical protein
MNLITVMLCFFVSISSVTALASTQLNSSVTALASTQSSSSVTAFASTQSSESETEKMESSEENTYDFKTFHWGDSQEIVEAVEGEPTKKGDMSGVDAYYIAYETTVAGKDAVLAYYFCSDGLFETRYVLTEKHSNEDLYIDDYDDVRTALTKKYGEPDVDSENWSNDNKKSYYADRKGDALSYGYLSYMTGYLLDKTTVLMKMSADNYKITTTVDFQSEELFPGEADYSDDF